MIFPTAPFTEKRKTLRTAIKSGKLLRFPGSFSPLTSMMIEQKGFEGIYISGGVLATDLGVPDIGLTTLTEVSRRGRDISRTTRLPAIIDIDTGFGEPMSVARTIIELQEMGLAGCHLEDQRNPKRCGHLDNKEIVPVAEMVAKVKAAASAKMDQNFLLIARTDARAQEGLEKAIDRAKAYVDAGAEMIFPEALKDEKEFETFRKRVSVPLLANMTEFGKGPLLTTSQLENIGFNMVIYPVTTWRLAMGAVETGLDSILANGTQEGVLDIMQTRKRLYEVVRYDDYNQFDSKVFNFSQDNHE